MSAKETSEPVDKTPPSWSHNQDLSFGKIRDGLRILEEGTRQAIGQAEAEVKRLVALRKRMTGR